MFRPCLLPLFLLTACAASAPKTADSSDREVTGVVVDVNLDGVALDGPALLTLRTEEGETAVIEIPSMGIRLCAAAERIGDPFTIQAGDLVSTRGEVVENDRIRPCESPGHYLEVTGAENR